MVKKPSVTLQTPRWIVVKSLLPPFNHFGLSGITFHDHPNTKTDTESDVNQKRFFTHFEGSIQSY